MKIDVTNETLQRRYLLGSASDAEGEAIEAQFLADDNFFEEMSAIEDELYVEYAAGELDADEARLFEQKFLRTQADRRRAAFADAFVATTAEMTATEAPRTADVPADHSILASLGAFFGLSGNALSYGMAAAVVLLAVGAGFLLVQNSGLRRDVASIDDERARERHEQERILGEKQAVQAELERQLAELNDRSRTDQQRINEIETERDRLQNEIRENREKLDRMPVAPGRREAPAGQRSIVALFLSPGLATRSPGEDDPNRGYCPKIHRISR